MHDVMRMVVSKVMYENAIDLFMAPENTLPPRKIGGASDPTLNRRSGVGSSSTFTALVGIPEVTLPAGYTRVVHEPRFELSEDGTSYEEVSGTESSELRVPMPIALTFWAGPGDEPTLYKWLPPTRLRRSTESLPRTSARSIEVPYARAQGHEARRREARQHQYRHPHRRGPRSNPNPLASSRVQGGAQRGSFPEALEEAPRH